MTMYNTLKPTLFVFLVILLTSGQFKLSATELSIIPKPNQIVVSKGEFTFTPTTTIYVNENSATNVAQYFEHLLNPATGFKLTIKEYSTGQFQKNSVYLIIDKSMKQAEGYQLNVTSEHITVTAKTAKGLFYGVQTVRQLLPAKIEQQFPINNVRWSVPAVQIKDNPRFAYRGMHLDVGRHFYSVEFIKKYIDLIALHKLNKFHWHLTEDQGWRIEIKQYPKLTTVGGYRDGTVYGHPWDENTRNDKVNYGGFYSQAEIKDIVAYAKERFVTIIPEIDLPGHTVAALAAYPELACSGKSFNVRSKWGVSKDVLCPSETTFTFIENVLNEVMDLFPSEYIHIGGDEAPKDRWKASPLAQQVIKDNHLKDEFELQSYFIKRLEKMLNKRNRKLIGWDEILEGGLSDTATVMFWRSWGENKKHIQQVLEQGNPVIMTPVSHLYFDYYQSESMDEPLVWGAYLPLKKVYSYDPVFDGLTDKQAQHVMGAQGNLWTEYIQTERMVEYQSQPRMAAVAELTWSAKQDKSWSSFITRLDKHFNRLTAMDVNASTSVYNVYGEFSEDKKTITLNTDGENHRIRYTIDGSQPTHQSAVYHAPINLDKTLHIRAIAENKETLQHFGDYKQSYINHLAVNKEITFMGETSANLHALGREILTDGIISHNRHTIRNKWFGEKNKTMIAIIDLESATKVSKVTFGFQPEKGIRMISPKQTIVDVSTDGQHWDNLALHETSNAYNSGQSSIEIAFSSHKARYIRLTTVEGYRFDEIIVE